MVPVRENGSLPIGNTSVKLKVEGKEACIVVGYPVHVISIHTGLCQINTMTIVTYSICITLSTFGVVLDIMLNCIKYIVYTEDIIRLREDMDFMFEWQDRYH